MAATRSKVEKPATEDETRSERQSGVNEPETTPDTDETTESAEAAPAAAEMAEAAPAPVAAKADGPSLFSTPPAASPFAAQATEIASTGVRAGNQWHAGRCAACNGAVTGEDRYEDDRYAGCRYECANCGKVAASHQEIIRP